MPDEAKKIIDQYHGRDVVKATVKITKAGDGLSKTMIIDGEFPELEIGDRALILMEVEVADVNIGAAIPGDRKTGPLAYKLNLEAQAVSFTATSANQKAVDRVKSKLQESTQIRGQRSIKDELGPDEDDAPAGGLDDGDDSE